MPSLVINSRNVSDFIFEVTFNIEQNAVRFNTSKTVWNNSSNSGALFVQWIGFQLTDQYGTILCDFDDFKITSPATVTEIVYDTSGIDLAFFFQNYKIVGALKDQDGNVYYTTPVFKKIAVPKEGYEQNNYSGDELQYAGYSNGIFQLTPDCVNNSLLVKELTPLVYNGLKPVSTIKVGTLYYPTGTIGSVSFTATPFTNDIVYTGQYKIDNTTEATYSLEDGVYVVVVHKTINTFDVTCSNNMSEVLCCILEIQQEKDRNCNNARGLAATEKLNSIIIPLMTGFIKETNGQDASEQVLEIRNKLKCNCGGKSLRQNELTPVTPNIYSIVLQGINGTTVPSSTINGNTKTYLISSDSYQIIKANSQDLGFSISKDISTTGIVKYKLAFNYDKIATYVLNAIGNDNTLITQLNSLISATTSIDLSNLNGRDIINLSSVNYFVSILIPSSSVLVSSVNIGGTTYNAPANLLVTNESGIEAWLNGLGVGTYASSYSSSTSGTYFNISSSSNTNNPVSITLSINGALSVYAFQKTNKSLVAVLQAIIDYLTYLSALQVALGRALSFTYINTNGDSVTDSFLTTDTQDDYNVGVATAISSLAGRIAALTSVNCTKIKSLFGTYPNATFGANDYFMSVINGNCTAANDKQVSLAIIAAINKYSDVKTAFCAINCTTPSTCPEVSSTSLNAVGTNIGFYSLTWQTTPVATQTVTVRYRVVGASTWVVATNNLQILPNGNISGTTPFEISNVVEGTAYQIWVQNNCGGSGFISVITTPSQGIYSGLFLLNNVIYNICAATPVTLYSAQPFGQGVTMYRDSTFSTKVLEYSLISAETGGAIYYLGNTTGIVGNSTGATCFAGTAGFYRLGATTSGICGQSQVTLYTDGTFAIGKTLYLDAALTQPISNSSLYVVDISSGHIYSVSSAVVGSDTGLTCSLAIVQVLNDAVDSTITIVLNITGFSLSSPLTFNQTANGTHTPFTAAISVSITGITASMTVDLNVNGTIIESNNIDADGTTAFSSRLYSATDNISIATYY